MTGSRVTRTSKALNREKKAWVQGAVCMLAEVHRLLLEGNDSIGIRRICHGADITLSLAKKCDVNEYDLNELRRAGVPQGDDDA